MEIIKPIKPDFLNKTYDYIGYPFLSKDQNLTHYSGHYLKYIKNFNKEICENEKLKKIYNIIITDNHLHNNSRKLFILSVINLFNTNTDIYHNCSQIYNHELYWKTLDFNKDSIQKLCYQKNKLFINESDFNDFFNKFITKGLSHFGSGWLWILFDKNKKILDIETSHDSIVLLNDDNRIILGCIDLWEHAYYIDYKADKKKYLEKSFLIINWNYLFNKLYK